MARGVLVVTRGRLPGDILVCPNFWGGGNEMLLTSSGQRPGALLDVRQRTGHPHVAATLPASSANSAKGEKLVSPHPSYPRGEVRGTAQGDGGRATAMESRRARRGRGLSLSLGAPLRPARPVSKLCTHRDSQERSCSQTPEHPSQPTSPGRGLPCRLCDRVRLPGPLAWADSSGA